MKMILLGDYSLAHFFHLYAHRYQLTNILKFSLTYTLLTQAVREPINPTIHTRDAEKHSAQPRRKSPLFFFFFFLPSLNYFGGCPRGVMVNVMGCKIVISEFVLQSRY